MTSIDRPQTAPAILLEKGVAQTANDCAAYAAGSLNFTAARDIYGDATVKTALRTMQHGKCAYCEAVVRDNPGTIDHYRPCKAVQQVKGGEVLRPGYFWLAYRWENLLFACIDCNQNRKRFCFPLADPQTRARWPEGDIDREEPLLIDPSAEPVADCLRFRKEMLEAIDGNVRGTTTIEVLGLNDERRALVGSRRRHLQLYQRLAHIAAQPQPLAAEAQRLLDEAMDPLSEFRAMMLAEFGD